MGSDRRRVRSGYAYVTLYAFHCVYGADAEQNVSNIKCNI